MLPANEKLRLDNEKHCAAIAAELREVTREESELTSKISRLVNAITRTEAKKSAARNNLEERRRLENALVSLRREKTRLANELDATRNRIGELRQDARVRNCGL